MNKHRRRTLIWIGFSVFLVISSAITALLIAFWYVVWPIPPKWVAIHSPWTAPQVRALGIVHRWGTDADLVLQCLMSFSERFLDHREESEAGILECMRSQDHVTLDMACRMIHFMKRKAELSPEICAEIVRVINDPNPSTRDVALSCVKLMPTAQSQPILTAWLHAGDTNLTYYAIDGLAKPGAFELTEYILPWLYDEELRYVALQLLVRIRDPATIEAVRMYAHDPRSHVRDEVSRFFRAMSSELGREIEP